MPELPEVETIRRGLVTKVIGKTIERIEIRCPRIILHPSPARLQQLMTHQTIQQISRRGKFLVFDIGKFRLLVHLGMTGQLTYWDRAQKDDEKFIRHSLTGLERAQQHGVDSHTHISFYFTDGNALHYRDVRQFGKWRLYQPEQLMAAPEFSKLGLEPFTSEYSWSKFQKGIKARKRCIKSLLLDQHFVAGVGNIYADEALFEARIHPERRASLLTQDEQRRLFRAIPKVLRRGLKHGGTSFQNYINAEGKPGSNQERVKVYGRDRKRCLRCRTRIERIIVGQRSTHFCPRCQPN
jgi:formamidopyrimidine-DNA glycosylase